MMRCMQATGRCFTSSTRDSTRQTSPLLVREIGKREREGDRGREGGEKEKERLTDPNR